jgi:hypothetical protein
MRPIFFTKQGIFESRFFQSRMLGLNRPRVLRVSRSEARLEARASPTPNQGFAALFS